MARSKHNPYRPEEDQLILDLWDQVPRREIAQRLDRPPESVSKRARKLGLPRQARRWTPEEDQVLRRLFRTRPTAYVARILDRPVQQCAYRGRRLGLQSHNRGGAAARG